MCLVMRMSNFIQFMFKSRKTRKCEPADDYTGREATLCPNQGF